MCRPVAPLPPRKQEASSEASRYLIADPQVRPAAIHSARPAVLPGNSRKAKANLREDRAPSIPRAQHRAAMRAQAHPVPVQASVLVPDLALPALAVSAHAPVRVALHLPEKLHVRSAQPQEGAVDARSTPRRRKAR